MASSIIQEKEGFNPLTVINMKKFIIETTSERITAHTGLAIIGDLIYQTNLSERLNQTILREGDFNPDCTNGDVASSYIGLLC